MKGRPAAHEFAQGEMNLRLTFGIDLAGELVQDQDARIAHEARARAIRCFSRAGHASVRLRRCANRSPRQLLDDFVGECLFGPPPRPVAGCRRLP